VGRLGYEGEGLRTCGPVAAAGPTPAVIGSYVRFAEPISPAGSKRLHMVRLGSVDSELTFSQDHRPRGRPSVEASNNV